MRENKYKFSKSILAAGRCSEALGIDLKTPLNLALNTWSSGFRGLGFSLLITWVVNQVPGTAHLQFKTTGPNSYSVLT